MKLLTFFLLFIFALPALATQREMRDLIKTTRGSMYEGQLPGGYRSVAVPSVPVTGDLKRFIERTTPKKQRDWRSLVLTSGEYDHVSLAERRRIAANPLAELKVSALLEIDVVYAIYKGNRLVGYFVQIIDHVQAAIYQDGAWYDAFFDPAMKLVEITEQSS
jgi:hypothetical protein